MSDILSYTNALLKVPVRAVDSAVRRLASKPGQSYTSTASKKRKSFVLAAQSKENGEPKGVKKDNNYDAASPRQSLPPPTMDQIRVLLQLWKLGMVSGDAKAVADRYSPNAVLIPFDSDIPLTSRRAIQAYYERILPVYKPSSIKVLHGNVSIPGATENECCLAHDNGIYDLMTPCGNLVRMRYTFVYVRDSKNGQWRIVHHSSSKICVIEDSPLASTDEYSKTRNVQERTCCNNNDEGTKDKETKKLPSEETADSRIPPTRRRSQIDHLVGMLTGTKTITQNDLILLSMSGKPSPVAEMTMLQLN